MDRVEVNAAYKGGSVSVDLVIILSHSPLFLLSFVVNLTFAMRFVMLSISAALAAAVPALAQGSQQFYMNIYANEDCNTYKSTQQLGNGEDSPSYSCINIDWAESWAVDVNNAGPAENCFINTYENEDCSGIVATHSWTNTNSGCQDSPFAVKSVWFECNNGE